MNLLTNQQAKLAWANNETLLINNTAENGWEDFIPKNWGCEVFDHFQFQIKPKVIWIGDYEIPEPVKEPLNKGQVYFVPSILTEKPVSQLKWKNSANDKILLERGLIHIEHDHAMKHAIAQIMVSGGAIQCNDSGLQDIDNTYQNKIDPEPISFKPIPDTVAKTTAQTANEADTEDVLKPLNTQTYQEQLAELIEIAKVATTPNQANALTRYTRDWTEEQRKPLLTVINKRLVELDQPNRSLKVRIQNAADMETLIQLEQEVMQCDAFIQPLLNDDLTRRREALTGFTF